MRSVYGWSLAVLMCVSGVASAQVRPGARPGAAAAPAAAPAAATQQGTPDQQIAACLWAANRNEVEIAKLAEQKAKSDSVKDFAAQMIKDHTQNADKLARVAGNLVSATARAGTGTREVRKPVLDDAREDKKEGKEEKKESKDDEGARGKSRDNAAPAAERREAREEAREDRREGREEAREDRRVERTTAAAAPAGRQPFNWVTIHREVADQCLQSAKKELGQKEGNEFDKCYIGMQVAAHMKMVDELKVLKNHASGQLQQDLEQSLETTEHHLSEAKKIMEEIKDKPDQK
jgi:predicted outer membrane protein